MSVKLINANLGSDSYVSELAKIIRLSYGIEKEPNVERDLQTIRNCFNAGHMSVFEFVDATVLIKCPIYVARQIMRYRCASYLERSLRRCEPLSYSLFKTYEYTYGCKTKQDKWYAATTELYEAAIKRGMRRENARACLPLGMDTQFYMKANLREWFHIFDERINTAAQLETNYLVQGIKEALKDAYPLLIELWEDKRKTETSAENLNA